MWLPISYPTTNKQYEHKDQKLKNTNERGWERKGKEDIHMTMPQFLLLFRKGFVELLRNDELHTNQSIFENKDIKIYKTDIKKRETMQ